VGLRDSRERWKLRKQINIPQQSLAEHSMLQPQSCSEGMELPTHEGHHSTAWEAKMNCRVCLNRAWHYISCPKYSITSHFGCKLKGQDWLLDIIVGKVREFFIKVYNKWRILSAVGKLRMWLCISGTFHMRNMTILFGSIASFLP